MKCTIRWIPDSGMTFLAETSSGHLVPMDGAADGGGRNLGPRPLELMLAGAGACTAYDVVLILRRGRHEIRGCEVELAAERATEDPKVFTRLEYRFRVSGLPHEAVERAVQLSHDKYCSATAMLALSAKIETSFEIVEVDAA